MSNKLTFVSTLFVQTLAFDRSIFVSFIGFFILASISLSVVLSVDALLGHDCFRRPDDDLELSFWNSIPLSVMLMLMLLPTFAFQTDTRPSINQSINIYHTLTNAIGCSVMLLRLMFNADGIGRPSVRHVIICLSNWVASFPVPFPATKQNNFNINKLLVRIQHPDCENSHIPVDLASACHSCVVAGSVRWSSDLLLSGVSRPDGVLLLKLLLCL